MGQRVNIVLKVTDKENKTKVTIYHDQWGIGRKGLLNIIALHHALYNREFGKSITETVHLYPEQCGIINLCEFVYEKSKLTGRWKTDPGGFKTLKNVSVPSKIGEFIDSNCDNNNGAVYIEVTEKKAEGTTLPEYEMKIGFLLGHEDEYGVYNYSHGPKIYNKENEKYGKAFSRWLSLEEWCNLGINRSYADEEFKKICKEFFDYFGIEEMKS